MLSDPPALLDPLLSYADRESGPSTFMVSGAAQFFAQRPLHRRVGPMFAIQAGVHRNTGADAHNEKPASYLG